MNHRTLSALTACFILLTVGTDARLRETEAEIEARYGKPVSEEEYRNFNLGYEMDHPVDPERQEIARRDYRRIYPERFNSDGTEISTVGEDAMIHADSRLIFFNIATSNWEDLRSSVIGRYATIHDNDALKQLTANARKHLRQRFYILNGISISVVYLGGRSVSEAYQGQTFSKEMMDELIKKSFPDDFLHENHSGGEGEQRLIRIQAADSTELRGCATHVDGVLTVTASPYFGFLKAMEDGLKRNAEVQQKKRIDGF